ncbi:MAG: 4Fe-4S dicluster domain-containing protein [Mariprofundales bacterium]|nr:4Fe-4S dicluster domain-containing protein [Mariprofundales bacterium]
MNAQMEAVAITPCTRCQQGCPSQAIQLDTKRLPQLDGALCTGCTACVHACPSDAITHRDLNPEKLLQQAKQQVIEGVCTIGVACSAVADANIDTDAALRVACHASWDPLLLACMAADGVKRLNLIGLDGCASCAIAAGAEVMAQTERDYSTLNAALGVRMAIGHHAKSGAAKPAEAAFPDVVEPPRRAFFRKLIPSFSQSAVVVAAQIGQAASQALRQELSRELSRERSREQADAAQASDTIPRQRPLRLRMFVRALPRLQPNFTPVPYLAGIPLGAIQADDRCTACAQCIQCCPTQALDMREFGSNRVLEFQPDRCIGCLRCVAICPEDALEPLPGISLPAILAGGSRPLVMVHASKYAN